MPLLCPPPLSHDSARDPRTGPWHARIGCAAARQTLLSLLLGACSLVIDSGAARAEMPPATSGTATADPGRWSLVLNGYSHHFDVAPAYAAQGLNANNWGLGFQYDLPRPAGQAWGWILNGGFYRDSSFGWAKYLGGGWLHEVARHDVWRVQLGIEVSAFYSPKYNAGRPFVALLPVATVGTDAVAVNIAVAPRISGVVDAGVVFFQLRLALP